MIKVAAVLTGGLEKNVLEIGEDLLRLGCDRIADLGIWVWDVKTDVEFYSPKFRASLGFEGEHDFPSVAASWQKYIDPADLKIAEANYQRAISTPNTDTDSYYQKVSYTKKNGEQIRLLCSGTVVFDKENNPLFLVGTHKKIAA